MNKTKTLIGVLTTVGALSGGVYLGFHDQAPLSSSSINSGEGTEIVHESDQPPAETVGAGDELVTYVDTEVGEVAVKLSLPEEPRYAEGAPIVALTSVFFTNASGFNNNVFGVTEYGMVHVSYLWPGQDDRRYGASSEGEYTHGDEEAIAAFAQVLAFLTEEIPNVDGYYLNELSEMPLITDNVGLYAFSHPGIAATNVMAWHGDELPGIAYFVGRENPTLDTLNSVELGHYDGRNTVLNPFYSYPESYSSDGIEIDYSTVRYDSNRGVPYFDLNGNERADGSDYILGDRVPEIYGKHVYSIDLTEALLENGALSLDDWPEDLATPDEVNAWWPSRTSTGNYDALASLASQMRVMLVFADVDHVQPAEDKPHIHHAYDGFTGAGLWVRLNPDSSYVQSVDSRMGSVSPDNDANSEPSNWLNIVDWAYENIRGASEVFPVAAVLEMADRSYYDEWSDNLGSVL